MYLPSTVCHGTTYMWVDVGPFAFHTMCIVMACGSTHTHKHVCLPFPAASARVTVRLAQRRPGARPIVVRLAEKVSQVSHTLHSVIRLYYYTILYYNILYYAIPYYTMLYYTILCYTILYQY